MQSIQVDLVGLGATIGVEEAAVRAMQVRHVTLPFLFPCGSDVGTHCWMLLRWVGWGDLYCLRAKHAQAETGGNLEAVAERLYAQGAYLVRPILKPIGKTVVTGGGPRVVWCVVRAIASWGCMARAMLNRLCCQGRRKFGEKPC